MLKIKLINMPIAHIHWPAIGLMQLQNVVRKRYGDTVSVDIHYLNHDFAHFLGMDLIQLFGNGGYYDYGIGDWFFRPVAFPDSPDNSDAYFKFFYPQRYGFPRLLKNIIFCKQRELTSFFEQAIEKYHLDQADIVGFTSQFAQNVASFALSRKIKEKNSETLAVMGGPNCESTMGIEIIKHIPSIDYVFSGPALRSFLEFVRLCLDQERDRCDSIKGVFSKRNYEKIAQGDFLGDFNIEDIPEIDYGPFITQIKRTFPNQSIKPVLFFQTSQGCWWGERSHCTFCALNGSQIKYQSLSPEKAVKQIKSLFRYAPECKYIYAVDNIMPKNYITEVFPRLNPPHSVYIAYSVRADLREKDIKILSKASIKGIQPGIESLSTSTLKLMKKGTTAFQNLLFLMYCKIHGIYPEWGLLIGFPSENESIYEKYIRDIPFLLHLHPPAAVNRVRFDRFSPYFNRAEEHGLDLHPAAFYHFIYPFDEQAIANLAYYFDDQKQTSTELDKWMGKIEEVVSFWRNRWYCRDDRTHPDLYRKDIGKDTLIYDSRSGDVKEYVIDKKDKEILEYLVKPRGQDKILSDLCPVETLGFSKRIDSLKEKGLLFCEDGRFLSIVLPWKQN